MRLEHSLGQARAGSGEVIDFSGRWRNELDSEMSITQDGIQIFGDYLSRVSSTGSTAHGKLCGYVNGSLIAFVVHWDAVQAITSWVGQLDAARPEVLNTLWQMTKQVDEVDEWASINAGSDSFTRHSR